MTWDVVGIGNAIVDVLVTIDGEALDGLPRGISTMVPDESTWRSHFAKVSHLDVARCSGGSCANTLSVLGQLGARTAFHGCVGADDEGRGYAEGLAAAGVHADLVTSPDAPTGKCLAVISRQDAERTMFTLLAAASEHHRLTQFDHALTQTRVVHVEGYMLFGDAFSVTLDAVQRAKAAGATISFDASDPSVVMFAGDRVRQLLPLTDIVFLNAEEAHHLTGVDAHDAPALVAATWGIRTVVVKLGAEGSLILEAGQLHRIAVVATHAVDTTGAGDSYAGGYLYGWLQGWRPDRAGRLASAIASATVSQVGAVVRDASRLQAMAATP
jgi:sugar/nucleoside kinase (ribokinase family)